jgi:hypothetical protein
MGKQIRSLAALGLSVGVVAISASAVWAQFQIPMPKLPKLPTSIPMPKIPQPQPRDQQQPAPSGQPADTAPSAPATPQDRFSRGQNQPGVQKLVKRPRSSGPNLPEEDQGILNELHRANVGKVVFTREDLSVQAITQAAFVEDFDLGQPMFFRVYMARSAVNEMMGKPGVDPDRGQVASNIQYRARFTVNGQPLHTTFHYFGEWEERNRYTTWRGQFVNRNPLAPRVPGSEVLREFITKGLSKGLLRTGTTAAVKMEVIPMFTPADGNSPPVVGPTVATGTFNLRIPASAINKSDPHICIPQGPRSPAVESAALAQARPAWLARDAQPVAARMAMDGWEVRRNEFTSVPIDRKTTVLIVARNPEYCYSSQYSWTEPFAGSGFSTGSGSLAFLPFVRTYFPCSCLD